MNCRGNAGVPASTATSNLANLSAIGMFRRTGKHHHACRWPELFGLDANGGHRTSENPAFCGVDTGFCRRWALGSDFAGFSA